MGNGSATATAGWHLPLQVVGAGTGYSCWLLYDMISSSQLDVPNGNLHAAQRPAGTADALAAVVVVGE
jgi:hypothetical protein